MAEPQFVDVMEAIEDVVCEQLSSIQGLANALDHEPLQLPKLPCTTMLVRRADPTQAETGPHDDVTYEWRLRLYVPLKDYRESQRQLKRLLPLVLYALRQNPTAYNGDVQLCDFLRVDDPGGEPQFAHEDGWLAKDLRISAVRTEGDPPPL